MTRLIPIRTHDLGPGIRKEVPADRIIEGNPQVEVWDQVTAMEGRVRSGVATGTAGTNRSIKGEVCEVVHLLEGLVELTEDGGETQTFRAGDTFVMTPGYVGTWKTIEDMRKIFVVTTP